MLNVKIKLKDGREVDLTKLVPWTEGGTITDYSNNEPQVIHWFPINDGSLMIFVSKDEHSANLGLLRATSPFAMKKLANVQPGKKYEMPITTKQGEGVLTFET